MIQITALDADGNAVSQLYQWDKGITVYLSSDYITGDTYVHFANRKNGTAYVVSGTYADSLLSVKIPDVLLESPYTIYGYVYMEDGDTGQTVVTFTVDVIRRAQPSDYVEAGTDDYITATSVLKEIEELLAQTEEAAEAAAESDNNAADSATLAKSWAVGGTGTRDGEDADNAKYYAEIAGSNASDNLGFYWGTDGYLWCTED